MMRSIGIWIVPFMLLASCGTQKAPENTTNAAENEANAAESVNQAATVAALPPAQRDGVFFRAIRDAGLPCQDIKASEKLPSEGKAMEWRAQCEDGRWHLISISPDGTAIVASRPD
ncbi:MAG: hypothetical protein J0G94_14570 [Sphingomonadales bacterium]|nr:hypothetical protein [Sphingomonadales bacterium]